MNNPQHDEQNEAGDVAAEHVRIFDTTLRDGEQTPGFSMDRRAKLRMAQMLEALGVDVLEAGFPQASPDDFAAVAQIASTLRDTTACALARCVPGDIDNAEEPAFQNGFTINDTDGDSNGGEELETENCDLNHGNSGGPMFAWWHNGTDPRIVGVVSSEETEYKFPFSSRNDNVFASGDGFVNLCAWGRSNWPA